VLTKEQRRDLIMALPPKPSIVELARALVGSEMGLFSCLLSCEALGNIRLAPLRADIDFKTLGDSQIYEFGDAWQQMAVAALDKGFSEQQIFFAEQCGSCSWSGDRSSMYAARLHPFEKLSQHPDPRLRSVGKLGVEWFSKRRDEELLLAKRAAIRGELL